MATRRTSPSCSVHCSRTDRSIIRAKHRADQADDWISLGAHPSEMRVAKLQAVESRMMTSFQLCRPQLQNNKQPPFQTCSREGGRQRVQD